MDPNKTYRLFCIALSEEDREAAKETHGDLRAWIERGGFEPIEWKMNPLARRQFFAFNPRTGNR
jgi:hypothetical protein